MKSIQEFMKETGATYAVVCDSTGEVWREFGDPHTLGTRGLVQAYLAGPLAAPALHQWVSDATVPQLVDQGSVACVVCRRSDGLIVAMLRDRNDNVMARFAWAEEIQNSVDDLSVIG